MKVLLLFFLLFFISIEGKLQKGSIIEKSDWFFVSKFCFDTEGLGNLTFKIWSASDVSNLRLLIYDDEESSWPAVYKDRKELTCEQKVESSKRSQSFENGKEMKLEFKDLVRPHFWYFAISNCGGEKTNIKFEFEFLNGGGSWSRQFSFDEQGLEGMYLFFWLFFVILMAIHFRGVYTLIRAHAFHPVIRLLSASLMLQTSSLFCIFVHLAIYQHNGVGAPGLNGLGEVLNMSSELLFIFFLILLAKGWAITRNQITEKRLLIIGACLFFVAYLTMFIWEYVGRNPASTLYIYESVPGTILLVLRMLTMVWFLWSLRGSYLEETDSSKKNFYLIFGGIYTGWFLMLVLIVLIAIGVPGWNRMKMVTGMYLSMNALGFTILVFLFWPSRAQEYFRISGTDIFSGGELASYNSL